MFPRPGPVSVQSGETQNSGFQIAPQVFIAHVVMVQATYQVPSSQIATLAPR